MEVPHLYTSFQKQSRAVYRMLSSKSYFMRFANTAVDSTTLSSKDYGLCAQIKSQTKYRVFTI
jgi:hypothetical protein